MKITDVLRLLKAGYTRSEIGEMLEDEKTEENEDEKIEENVDEKPEDENDNKHYVDEIAKLTEKVEMLTKTLQEVNREKAEGNAPDVISGEQILKDIIEGKVK